MKKDNFVHTCPRRPHIAVYPNSCSNVESHGTKFTKTSEGVDSNKQAKGWSRLSSL